ncbi:hypothetical protein ACFWCF_04880 [Rhodococcus sp. NPDC060090]|uniref:hypothetical protein n=1 Tax=Rhodococcus sp. NPDC060090 TaxID=3347056 RepID=UPI00365A9506
MTAPDGRKGSRPDPVALDLIPAQLLAPRARKLATLAVLAGALVGTVVWLVAPWWVAILVAAVVALPPALGVFAATKRHIRLDGTVITASGLFRSRSVELEHLAGVELLVRTARVSQVIARVNDGSHGLIMIPLALYSGEGGRELDILALRKLADAFASSELASAAAISSVLVEQLRAEARGAGLGERPLYRAVELARTAGRVPQTTLTDHEVASLVE